MAESEDAQWAKDSRRMELVADCQYPTSQVLDDIYHSISLWGETSLVKGRVSCREGFTHMPTQRGICSVFNGESLGRIVDTSRSVWMAAFHK